MNEKPTNLPSIEEINSEELNEKLISKEAMQKRAVERLLEEAVEMTRHEIFPFTSIKQESYDKMKADDDLCPGYTTPIHEIRERMGKEGMKISLGENPKSGNIFVLPGKSDDFKMDSVLLKNIELNSALSKKVEEIRSIITAVRNLEALTPAEYVLLVMSAHNKKII